jgi:hypothetical protein
VWEHGRKVGEVETVFAEGGNKTIRETFDLKKGAKIFCVKEVMDNVGDEPTKVSYYD